MSARRPRTAFTLIEALVAVVVVSIAIVGSMEGFHSLARTETRAQQSEYLQRLAYEKYDEEIATAPLQLANTSGDFSDRNLPGYSWNLTITQTPVTDLMAVTVTVTQDNSSGSAYPSKGVANGLYYQTQQTGSSTGGGSATP